MKINIDKTKYLIQSGVLALAFVFLAVPAGASEITPDNIINYVNMARESQGKNSLIISDKLTRIAEDKLKDMIANRYFAHTSPSGVNPWYWFQKEGYDYHFAGENLAINFKTAEDEQTAWMASPMHRKNILDDNFQEIGVAVGTQETGGQTSIIAVQEFGATFAGVPTGEKKFSPLQYSDMMEKDGKIVPQVLSAKNTSPEQNVAGGDRNGGLPSFSDQLLKNKIVVVERTFLVAMFFLFFSSALSATAFLALAAERLRNIFEDARRLEKAQNQT